MADNSAAIAKMARILAIIHIIIGILLIIFGIADRFVESHVAWTGSVYFGIWIGAWMCITGGLGIPGSRRERAGSRNNFAGVFMGFSITSAVLGAVIIYAYSGSIYQFRKLKNAENSVYSIYRYNYDASMAIRAIILTFGISEFVIGIWAAICCCLITRCGCCATEQQGQQVVYAANPTGYVMAQGADGVPVAVPVQAGDGMVAFQASDTQGYQPPVVIVPMGGQPMTAQASPTKELFATGYQPQQEKNLPHYEI